MKRLGYQSMDVVNEATVEELAAECGARMVPLFLKGRRPNGDLDGVLYDLDYLPPDRRDELLAELLASPPECPAGVHSFNLQDEQKKALRRNGIVVSRRLGRTLIRRLLALPDVERVLPAALVADECRELPSLDFVQLRWRP